ncbi:hypothetical protein SLLC_35800 [Streptomyces lavendulae subsp. lavendulae]|nr:hypothetical protein SLLC_35800 [Streptomyces lavendulae subsp. lavendulae]
MTVEAAYPAPRVSFVERDVSTAVNTRVTVMTTNKPSLFPKPISQL